MAASGPHAWPARQQPIGPAVNRGAPAPSSYRFPPHPCAPPPASALPTATSPPPQPPPSLSPAVHLTRPPGLGAVPCLFRSNWRVRSLWRSCAAMRDATSCLQPRSLAAQQFVGLSMRLIGGMQTATQRAGCRRSMQPSGMRGRCVACKQSCDVLVFQCHAPSSTGDVCPFASPPAYSGRPLAQHTVTSLLTRERHRTVPTHSFNKASCPLQGQRTRCGVEKGRQHARGSHSAETGQEKTELGNGQAKTETRREGFRTSQVSYITTEGHARVTLGLSADLSCQVSKLSEI